MVQIAICRDSSNSSAPASAEVLTLAAEASKAVQERIDPGTLRTAALLDLIWHDSAGNSVSRSIKYLQTAARLDPRSSAVLVDLSAAYIVRAARSQSPRDLLEAVESASLALELDAKNEAALFNIALAEERLGLMRAAEQRWNTYAQLDSRSGWGNEAKARSRAIASRRASVPAPSVDAPPTTLAAFADTDPQAALALGWRTLLGDWGAAVLSGDSTRASIRLAAAGAIGDALSRRNRDASLSDAVQTIRTHAADRAATSALAEGHQQLAAGIATHDSAHFRAASTLFDRSLAARAPSPALTAWASMYRGLVFTPAGRADSAERVLTTVATTNDTLRYPALVGRARWGLGTVYLRRGRYELALEDYRRAIAMHERAGDAEYVAGLHALAAQAEFAVGDAQSGFNSLRRALATLPPGGEPARLHNILYALQKAAAAEGLSRAALIAAEEDVAVSARAGLPINLAEARLARARLRAELGLTSDAAADRDSVRAALPELVEDARPWFNAHLQQVTGDAVLRSNPPVAIAALDSAASYFQRLNNALRLLPILIARAEARLLQGDAAGAEIDLAQATTLLAAQRDSIGRVEYRVSMIEGARRVFDRLVMLRIAAGRPIDALEYLERSRVTLAPPASVDMSTRASSRFETLRAPQRTTVLDYALVGDTLLIWVATSDRISFERRLVARDSLTRTIERVRGALELGATEERLAGDLVRLNNWLVRPVAGMIDDSVTIAVIADGEISGVPFAALRDSSGTFLIERHSLRFANSFVDVAAAAPPRRDAGLVALIANPEGSAVDALSPIPGAMDEVELIAALYEPDRVMRRTGATRPVLVDAMRRATVVHFAGHAVFDPDRPERSFLVLAQDSSGTERSHRLSAAELARTDLGRVRLVALSACETLPARRGRTGGISGLAAAMLVGGADGVVGTDWRVDDRLARDLMVEFHRAYRRLGGDGPRALRAAQLEMLRSQDPARRPPASWAGFRYAGS